jgi:nucleotide-binding universal stress UspA family protein
VSQETLGRGSAEQLEETRASYEAHVQARADETLKRAGTIAEAAKVACDSVKLLSDQPYEEIIETATNRGCDLVAMASHGRRGLAAVLLGSQTMKVLVSSKIPVLVFR